MALTSSSTEKKKLSRSDTKFEIPTSATDNDIQEFLLAIK